MLNRLLSHLFLLVAGLLESDTQARGNKKKKGRGRNKVHIQISRETKR